MKINTLAQIRSLIGKRVLLRADFNVPIKNGKVKEDYKIQKSLPTIKYLIDKGAKVIIVSHLGRPEGVDKKFSLKPAAKYLEYLLEKNVKIKEIKDKDKYFFNVKLEIDKMRNGEVLMLDNIRFFHEEEKNSGAFAKQLASLADIFVLDGFAVAHRPSASVSGIAKYLPAYAGFLFEEEINGLSRVMEHPKKPFVVILGGVKMETKIPVLKKLLPFADQILIGGGIFNTYLLAKGYRIGWSSIDKKFKKEALALEKNIKVVMPIDVVVGKKNGSGAKVIRPWHGIPNSEYGIYDIGPETVKLFASYIKRAETLVWNGALGYFEQHPYEYGTYSVARLVASRAKGKAFGVCGGGETVEILQKLKLMDDIDLVSTGGGAMLEFLSGKKLHGVEAVKIR